jgi:glycosyltransferase involved in cell wall biosynthesis
MQRYRRFERARALCKPVSGCADIAFVKMGDFSQINPRVHALLAREFPDLNLHVIDLNDRAPRAHLLSLWRSALAEYGLRAAKGKAALESCTQRTPRYFELARALSSEALGDRRYLFTFQTQSLFDASQAGTPHFVYTDHTHLANLYYPSFDRSKLFSPRWIDLERSIYRNATLNFTMSSHVTRSLIEHYGCERGKIECVAIGSNVASPNEHELSDARYASRRILFVGIDWERKGGPMLVKAFRKVLGLMPDAQLTIVGCSPTIDLPNCEVLGRLPLDELGAHYRRSAVFCMPTQNEPFGVVFLEAFEHRLPVIATDIGALPDVVQEGVSGYLVETGDVDALADRLYRLLMSPRLCKQFGESGHAHVRARYTWQSTGRRIANAIRGSLTALALVG